MEPYQDYGRNISLGAECYYYGPGFMSPVYDQRGPNCAAFAVTAALGARHAVLNPRRRVARDFSQKEIVDCNGPHQSVQSVYDYSRYYGLHLARDYPYDDPLPSDCLCYTLIDRPKWGIDMFWRLRREHVLDALNYLGPLTAAMDVYPTFHEHPNTRDVYSPELDEEPESTRHMVLVTGYGFDGDELYFIIKNSWGLDWGVNGYARVTPDLFYAFACPNIVRRLV